MEVVRADRVKRDGGIFRTRIWLKCGCSMDKALGFTGKDVTCRNCEPSVYRAEERARKQEELKVGVYQ